MQPKIVVFFIPLECIPKMFPLYIANRELDFFTTWEMSIMQERVSLSDVRFLTMGGLCLVMIFKKERLTDAPSMHVKVMRKTANFSDVLMSQKITVSLSTFILRVSMYENAKELHVSFFVPLVLHAIAVCSTLHIPIHSQSFSPCLELDASLGRHLTKNDASFICSASPFTLLGHPVD